MKKQLLIIGAAAAIVICILAAGCTGTVTEQTQTTQITPAEEQTAEVVTISAEMKAVDKAKSFLEVSPYSRGGLIDQLEYSGFTHDEAEYAADNCGADWSEQATMKAKFYLRENPYSHDGLIEQLEFNGFSSTEAMYGVDHCGADWVEQAKKKAQSLKRLSPSASKESIIMLLELDGFSHGQAATAVSEI